MVFGKEGTCVKSDPVTLLLHCFFSELQSVLARAAMTEHHRLVGLNNKHVFSPFWSLPGKSEINVLADSVFAESPFPSLYTAFFSLWDRMAFSRCMCLHVSTPVCVCV